MPEGVAIKPKVTKGKRKVEDTDAEEETKPKITTPRQRAKASGAPAGDPGTTSKRKAGARKEEELVKAPPEVKTATRKRGSKVAKADGAKPKGRQREARTKTKRKAAPSSELSEPPE